MMSSKSKPQHHDAKPDMLLFGQRIGDYTPETVIAIGQDLINDGAILKTIGVLRQLEERKQRKHRRRS